MGIARFEKVSYARFAESWKELSPLLTEEEIKRAYEQLRLPVRATAGSAGYDFFAPMDLRIPAQTEIKIATGIRAWMDPHYVLMLFPRSGLGFKYRLQLNNTVGIIDSDYYGADNEGHIMCRLFNDSRAGRDLVISEGEGMLQGVFVPFGITDDDEADGVRTGGFGSTTKKKV